VAQAAEVQAFAVILRKTALRNSLRQDGAGRATAADRPAAVESTHTPTAQEASRATALAAGPR
jgi:hypothetical protein